MNITLFFDLLAGVAGIACVIRVINVLRVERDHPGVVRQAEIMGLDPVGDALKWPAITVVVSILWFISRLQ